MAGRQEREGPMGELRDRMEADLRLRGYAEKTRVAYVSCVRAFARHFRRSPAALGEDEVRAYLTYLGDVRRVRPATQVVHAAALRFLYRITLHQPELAARVPRLRRPQTLPAVLSVEEVGQVLGAITAPKYRALFLTCYGAGLRIGEACALQVADIDSTRMLVHVRWGKGGHERYATLRTPATGQRRRLPHPRRGVSPAARALPRGTRDHARHRRLPRSRPRRAPRRVRPVPVRPPGVQLLPQSPLPEVRGLARGALDRGAHGPPRAEPLLPRRLHPARHAPPAGPAQPPTALHAAVPRRHADAPHRRPRSRPAGGTPRRDRRAAHLDPRPPVPSPPPLHRHGWGPRARPAAVDRHRPPPPLSGARPQPPLPRQVSRRPRPRVRRRPPRPPPRPHPARRTPPLPSLPE